MKQRLVCEDVFGMSEYDWNSETRTRFRFTKAQLRALEAGEMISTPLKGGTEFALVKDPDTGVDGAIVCPKCGHHFVFEMKSRRKA